MEHHSQNQPLEVYSVHLRSLHSNHKAHFLVELNKIFKISQPKGMGAWRPSHRKPKARACSSSSARCKSIISSSGLRAFGQLKCCINLVKIRHVGR